ncbi:hypothetical protein [Desulfovibrio porci]|uniref:hypothetical protein n=1 Tax=Desulfovibrio porci TaxID=2605782 RepID=UPI001E46B724|nr:hypothetical protein [Desulfovibrio porci]MDY3810136.1 hypothetical protein [Desulfovibrio porci]
MPDPRQPELTLDAPPAARWPEWAEEARLDDDLAAAAYEATPPACRAALKTGLALAHMHFGQSPGCLRESRGDPHLGFWRHTASFPAPWAVLAFTPEYAAAARLTAACVPALLADVPLVGAVCVGGAPHRAALVSLELSGVEDIFCLDETGLCALLEESQPGPGRLVLLHKGELDNVARAARVLGLPCYEERRAPALILPEPDAFDLDILAFAQGDALEQALEPARPTLPAAIYLRPEAARGHCKARRHGPFRYVGSLALSPGCEGFWLHAGLTPDFFTVSRLAFGPLRSIPS